MAAVQNSARLPLKLVVSGDKLFLDRYHGLLLALGTRAGSIEAIPSGDLLQLTPFRICKQLVKRTPLDGLFQTYLTSLHRDAGGFAIRSRQTEKKITGLRYVPD